jgi:hypothetical protein
MADDDLARELDYLAFLEDKQGPLRCYCRFQTHKGDACNEPAIVQIEVHFPHVCRHPRMIEHGIVGALGTTTQFLCSTCYVECRNWCDAKLAQHRDRIALMSAMCQQCGFGPLVGSKPVATPVGTAHTRTMLDRCPACGFDRVVFLPECGAGIKDSDGQSFGCGAKLETWRDIIRAERFGIDRGL